ncbi:hypothetical protein R3I94_016698 [Phoxinus phoxinus]
MPERERNAAEGKEKMTDEDKHVQKEKTFSRKENACGFKEHLILQQKNSIETYRPKFSLDPEGPAEKREIQG